MSTQTVILGCGDIGQRLATYLREQGNNSTVIGTNRSGRVTPDVLAKQLDLDSAVPDVTYCQSAQLFYLIPPQPTTEKDQRSRSLLSAFEQQAIIPEKVVLLSTTGVYGDCAGAWVTESSACAPDTERAKRRVDAEQQWQQWSERSTVPIVIIRVPGIYARSRIPSKRLAAGTPIVRAHECGFTNRIHADDLVQVLVAAMIRGKAAAIFNASDGRPGKLSEYLKAAAREIGLPPLPEISLEQAEAELSQGMMSYLRESRRINNEEMLSQLKVELRYPDFVQGLKFG